MKNLCFLCKFVKVGSFEYVSISKDDKSTEERIYSDKKAAQECFSQISLERYSKT